MEDKVKLGDFIYELESSINLKVKSAIIENKRFNYIRGKDLTAKLIEHKQLITTRMTELGFKLIFNNQKDFSQDFFDFCYKYRILLKTIKQPNDKLKYPTKLEPDRDVTVLGTFDENKYYCILYDKPFKKSSYVYLTLAIILVVSLTVFPLWPLWVKHAVWWLLVMFIILLVSLICYVTL